MSNNYTNNIISSLLFLSTVIPHSQTEHNKNCFIDIRKRWIKII
ncbi:hypothetical protein [Parvimonas micra]|nr:hypothetical protein [Parvimonas micra]